MTRFALALALLTLTACHTDSATLDSGEYHASSFIAPAGEYDTVEMTPPDWTLRLSMEARTFHFEGTDFELSGRLSADDTWHSACPSNISAIDEQVTRLDVDAIEVSGVRFVAPVLIALCEQPGTIALRSSDALGSFSPETIYFELAQ